jgi:hypothetical protein
VLKSNLAQRAALILGYIFRSDQMSLVSNTYHMGIANGREAKRVLDVDTKYAAMRAASVSSTQKRSPVVFSGDRPRSMICWAA